MAMISMTSDYASVSPGESLRMVGYLQEQPASQLLEILGYTYTDGKWLPPRGPVNVAGIGPVTLVSDLAEVGDALHHYLRGRIESLTGCAPDSPEEDELMHLQHIVEEYEFRRWPSRKNLK